MIGELVNRKRSSVLLTQHSRSLEGSIGEICMNVSIKIPIIFAVPLNPGYETQHFLGAQGPS
jgi:hypothetical protein